MSALDDVIIYHAENCQSGSECDLSALSRAELAQLRAKAAELDRIADLVDPLHAYDTPLYDQISNALHDDSTAALLRSENEAQAQQLEQAREAMTDIKNKYDSWRDAPDPNTKAFFLSVVNIAKAWLAANVPAETTREA